MPRKPRVHLFDAFYHVMLRGNDRMKIFFVEQDREYFYSLIDDGIKKYNHRVHGFCLMDNHVHLLIQVSNVSLSKIIHNLSCRYVRYINNVHNKVGHLFQARYKAILVDNDDYLLELIRYIHQNPICAKMVNRMEDYQWSSYSSYLGVSKIPWLTTGCIARFFSNPEFSLQKYIHFMHSNCAEIYMKYFESDKRRTD